MRMYKTMVRIRNFEEDVVELFAQGKLAGFVHCYIGEEAIATGDHRIIDGAEAAKFLNELKSIIENPLRIMI